jgi:hypothetical protein
LKVPEIRSGRGRLDLSQRSGKGAVLLLLSLLISCLWIAVTETHWVLVVDAVIVVVFLLWLWVREKRP